MSTYTEMLRTVASLRNQDGTLVVGAEVNGVHQSPVSWTSVTNFLGGARRQQEPYIDSGLSI